MNAIPETARERLREAEYGLACISEIMKAMSQANDGDITAASLAWLADRITDAASHVEHVEAFMICEKPDDCPDRAVNVSTKIPKRGGLP